MKILTPRFGFAVAAASLVAGAGIAATPTIAHAAPTYAVSGSAFTAAAADIPDCALSSLPTQATDTANLIQEGGPFPYPDNDGVVFDNREGILPAEDSGYYHEYTVITPGSDNRGTRRIVTGGSPLTSPPVWYYTGDHYSSFCKITGINGGGDPGGVPDCDASSVPDEVADTEQLIKDDGPFPYSQDGTVYENREGQLPAEDTGYYHLYTVPTPGDDTRGSRRIVTGGTSTTSPAAWYYTANDYSTFCKLAVN
ncbi:ribonuclease domain-containing protein [Flexivirga sp. B27]